MDCKLCGKPLPKIRLFRDGDFCCREHRDQYRLRRGLNQLAEAGELASLRRQRERPTHFPVQRRSCPGAPQRRFESGEYPAACHAASDFFVPPLKIHADMRLAPGGQIVNYPSQPGDSLERVRRPAADAPQLHPGIRFSRSTLAPRQAASADIRTPAAFRSPLGPRTAGAHASRRIESQKPVRHSPVVRSSRAFQVHLPGEAGWCQVAPNEPTALAPPGREVSPEWSVAGIAERRGPILPIAVPSSPDMAMAAPSFARIRRQAVRPEGDVPRLDGEFRSCIQSPVRFTEAGNRAMRVGHAEFAGAGILRSLPPARDAGRLERISAAADFAQGLPTLGALEALRGWKRAADLGALEEFRALVSAAAGAGPRGERVTCEARLGSGRLAYPESPAPAGRAAAGQAPVLPVRPAPRIPQRAARPRVLEIRQKPDRLADQMALPGNVRAIRSGKRELLATSPRGVAQRAARGNGAPQPALAPFPADTLLLRRVELNIQGTVAGTLEENGPGAVMRLEENFDSGLSRWAGATEDWRIDAAGVRTGALAFFTPSLGMRDYDLEFFTKIESRGVAWVFRAQDFQNYFVCRISQVGQAGSPAYELTRSAIVGGVEETPVTVALNIKIRSKASFRVLLSASGAEFTLSVEGQAVDSWSDSRLPTGGIGFLADHDDRARLYWVRLSSRGRFAAGATPAVKPGADRARVGSMNYE